MDWDIVSTLWTWTRIQSQLYGLGYSLYFMDWDKVSTLWTGIQSQLYRLGYNLCFLDWDKSTFWTAIQSLLWGWRFPHKGTTSFSYTMMVLFNVHQPKIIVAWAGTVRVAVFHSIIFVIALHIIDVAIFHMFIISSTAISHIFIHLFSTPRYTCARLTLNLFKIVLFLIRLSGLNCPNHFSQF